MNYRRFSIILCIGLFISLFYFLSKALPIGTGFTARYLCTHVFAQNRDPEYIFKREVQPEHALFQTVTYSINQNEKTVTAHSFGFFSKSIAVYRPGVGCVLAVDKKVTELVADAEGVREIAISEDSLPYLTQPGKPVDQSLKERMQLLVEDWLKEPSLNSTRNSRAILIAQGGMILGEGYDSQVTSTTPLLGWSMAKSVTGALIGILVKDGLIQLEQGSLFSEWNDDRRQITIHHLMQMSSGLVFEEVYGPMKDATYMLYDSYRMADYAMKKPLEVSPGKKWYYSSGTSNLLSLLVYKNAGATLLNTDNFIRQRLFEPLGMKTAFFETDSSGVFVGSSYMYASARDWARFGLLYLQNGKFNGQQILPDSWVTYATRPVAGAPLGEYGAQVRLNAGKPIGSLNRKWPNLPSEIYYFSGYNEQLVAIVPSMNLVIVRLGVTFDDSFKKEDFIEDVLQAIGP